MASCAAGISSEKSKIMDVSGGSNQRNTTLTSQMDQPPFHQLSTKEELHPTRITLSVPQIMFEVMVASTEPMYSRIRSRGSSIASLKYPMDLGFSGHLVEEPNTCLNPGFSGSAIILPASSGCEELKRQS